MKKFFFRLEALLRLRQAKEGRIQREISFQLKKISQLKEKKETLEKQIASLTSEISEMRAAKKHNLHETYEQILEHLNLSLRQVTQSLDLLEKQKEGQTAELRVAIQERKVIEKIKEKHYSGWRSAVENSESELLDEVSKRF